MWEEYYSALRRLPEWLKEPVQFVVASLAFLREQNAQTILDLGCGLGRNSIYLGSEGLTAIGVDISRNALKKTEAWARNEGIEKVAVLCASMTHLPFANQAFDAVISTSVIHHALKEDIKKTLKGISRVLRNNGVFLASLLSTRDYRHGSGEKLEDGTFRISEDFEEKHFEEVHHFFSKKEIQTLLADFQGINIKLIQSGFEKPHKYWKVIAIK